ncbi:MAG: hypothetical protein H5U33_17435, partial [Pseudomonas sp.]|nr:hypothetical protein [Pseudomonas sp.]
MTDYKATLNLPDTAFPMKAGLPQREPQILQRWDSIGLYGKLREIGKDRPKFATAETVALLGAKPVYVDVDPKT